MITLFEKPTEHMKENAPSASEETRPTQALSPFFDAYLKEREHLASSHNRGAEPTVKVSNILGSLAHIYEKIRNIVEYKGEHVLRRNAIERILKRLLWERATHDTHRIASILVRELIWARYLTNDSIPKSKVNEIAKIITKYLFFYGELKEHALPIKNGNLRNWVWGVAACEVEETLDPSFREPLVRLMYEWFTHYYDWLDEDVPAHTKQIQTYLAVHRALAKSDEAIMRYHLLLLQYPEWKKHDASTIKEVVTHFASMYEKIETHIAYPERLILYRYVQKHVAPFEILRNLIREEGALTRPLLMEVSKFEEKIKDICNRKYAQIQKKVNTGIVRSIIYIFVTKVFLALLIEIPYELYRLGHLTYIPLAINVIVPPGMMWILGLTIKTPGSENTDRILAKLKTIAYVSSDHPKTSFSLRQVRRGSALLSVFTFLYILLFALVFGGITYLLLLLHFMWVGIMIFFAFLSLVLLFGFRVRFTASELKVTSEKENIIEYMFNNLTLPFLSTGVYLSKGLAKLNVFSVVLDFLIEAPLKTIIEVIEEWTSFVREKREEVVEVPEQ